MGAYYTDSVLFIDTILLAVNISLAIIVIAYTITIKVIAKIRYRHLTSIISALQSLTHDNKGSIIEGCALLIKNTTPFEFLDITRHKEDILPSKFSRQLSECISASGKVKQTEGLARRSRRKWRRIEALISLGYINSPNAIKILGESVLDKDEDIAYFSLLALGHIKDIPSAQILLEAIKRRVISGYKIASILEHFPDNIVGILIKGAEDTDPILRYWSIKLLARFKPRQFIEKIISFTEDKLPDIRAAGCECLGEIREKATAGYVRKCLRDKIWFVRIHAVRALEKILGEHCLPDVACLLKDSEWFVRENVKEIMIRHIDKSLKYIEQSLCEGDRDIKEDCLEMLDVSGYSSRILDDITSQDPRIKDIAIRLLKAMVKAGGHFGLEGILGGYPGYKRQEVLKVIRTIDKDIAEHIEKKIKGEIIDI